MKKLLVILLGIAFAVAMYFANSNTTMVDLPKKEVFTLYAYWAFGWVTAVALFYKPKKD